MKYILLVLAIAVAACTPAQQYADTAQPVKGPGAPGLKYRLLADSGRSKTYVLIFTKGDELLSGLTDFANSKHIVNARFQGIGDWESAELGWFDRSNNKFLVNAVNEQMELTSLLGDIAISQGKPSVHCHATVSLKDGSAKGGHVLKAAVWPNTEVYLTAWADTLYKQKDPETGAGFINPYLYNVGK